MSTGKVKQRPRFLGCLIRQMTLQSEERDSQENNHVWGIWVGRGVFYFRLVICSLFFLGVKLEQVSWGFCGVEEGKEVKNSIVQ